MNYNATPVENLPAMPPQQNDPVLMSQVMRDAHMDHQARAQAPPSFHAQVPQIPMNQPAPAEAESNSFIPDIDVNSIIEKFKEPVLVAVLVFLLHTEVFQNLLKQNIPTIFQGDDVFKQILVKAGISGAAFFVMKQSFLNK